MSLDAIAKNMDEWTLNDLLECSVCLERLDTSSKVLPCQHTFCKKCLGEIIHTHKELRCPECRVLVDVDIDELPPNVLLMRILEGMKNATKKTSSGTEPRTNADHSKSSVVSAFSSSSRIRSGSHFVPDLRQPYAIAKCDCVCEEPGDLSFKRGDVILLRRKIEHHWYQGECNGVLGVFPVSYVKVVVPIPDNVPQCKALFDFSKCHEDDDGCLHFSKDDVINVIRRVDENWAEGKVDDRIGIFPISFVEMNYLAKNLMRTVSNPIIGASRDAPPTPTNDSARVSNERLNFVSHPPIQNIGEGPGLFSPSSSSSTTSTATTSPTSSSESTAPFSPSISPSAGSLTQFVPVKRHSFTPGAQPPPYYAPPAVHRYSVEIPILEDSITESLNSEKGSSHEFESRSRYQKIPLQAALQHVNTSTRVPLDEIPVRITHHRGKSRSELPVMESNHEAQSMNLTTKESDGILPFERQSSLRIPKSTLVHSKLIEPPPLPAMYIAIYPYKPQKTDELELKIGSVYTVIERCQDGWFKGTSHPNPKCGVFPGNYVTPVKSLPMLQAQLRGLVHSFNISPGYQTRVSPHTRLTSSPTKSNSTSSVITKIVSDSADPRLAPPKLPARSSSPVLVSNSRQKVSSKTWHVPTNGILDKSGLSSTSPKNHLKNIASDTNNTFPNVMEETDESNLSKPVEKSKDKKEKVSVSLMRRLTSIKKSRSPPPPPAYSIDSPVFENGSSSTLVHVAHARSDSCPSRLSYSTQAHATNSSSNHQTNLAGGSQRVKHKQRTCSQNQFMRTSDLETSIFSSNVTKMKKEDKVVINHRKSNSLDTTVFDEIHLEQNEGKSLDPPVRERYRCIAPYPPNSEFELELQVGDIIYVQKKRDDGWYRGTLQRNGRTGLFPVSFVENV